MCSSLHPTRRTWIAVFFAIVAAPFRAGFRPAQCQRPSGHLRGPDRWRELSGRGSQRPIKVESKLKKGTTYTLAVRVAMTQPLRLNSVQMEYGMWAKVTDNKGKDLRIAQINHELGFSLEITDLGQALDAKHQDDLLKTLADHAVQAIYGPQGDGIEADGTQGPEVRLLRRQVAEDRLQRLGRGGADLHDFRAFGGEVYRQRGGRVPGPGQGGRGSLGNECLGIHSAASVERNLFNHPTG